jgi:non-specific serine/threonine protein kinase
MVLNKIRTGISGLDEILQGGFPSNSIIAVFGPPGSGKSIFCMQFVDQGLKSGDSCIFLTTDRSPEEIKDIAKDFGWDLSDAIFIDDYSWRSGAESGGKYCIKDPSDLNYLNILIGDILKETRSEKKRIVIDSVSALILYNNPNFAMRFLHIIGAKARLYNSCMLITLESGVHDERAINLVNYIADGAIELDFIEGEGRRLRVLKMSRTKHDIGWKKFEFGKNGIILV